MNIKGLRDKLLQLTLEGHGDKPIYVENGDETLEIDSVAKNTNPDVEPDYYFLAPGERVKGEEI